MLFSNVSGEIVFSKGVDLLNQEERPVPVVLQKHITTGSLLLQHAHPDSSLTGLVLLPDGPLLVASRPIVNNHGQGPIGGTLIIGRYLDNAEIERLAELARLSLTIHRFDDPDVPGDFQTARSFLSAETPIFVRALGTESVAGYSLIEDIYGDPILILRAEMPREIHRQGQTSLSYLMLSILMTGLIFGGITLLLFERQILSRLAHLSKNVSRVSVSGDLTLRIPVTGKDELSSLGITINQMLATLEQAEQSLRLAHNNLEIRTAELTKANKDLQVEITQRKQAEAQIKTSLHEKEVLLQEIHHRVKNNLQVVSSLLSLQSGYINDNQVLQILKDSQSRVRSMALVHEKLYRSENLARIDLAEYIQDLIGYLFRSQNAQARGILSKVETDQVFLGIDQAVPCGLILNELVSNSLKHAFPDGQTGEIRIQLRTDKRNHRLTLMVSDSGVGLSNDIDIANPTSLGLQLVNSLVNQLDGEIDIHNQDGTNYRISFNTA